MLGGKDLGQLVRWFLLGLVALAVASCLPVVLGSPASEEAASLTILDTDICEISGNLDGVLDAGETGELRICLLNEGSGVAEKVQATLLSGDPFVTVEDASAYWGQIPAGESRWTAQNDFRIRIPPGYDKTSVDLILILRYNNITHPYLEYPPRFIVNHSLEIGVNKELWIDAATDRGWYNTGDQLTVTATVYNVFTAVREASVHANITGPGLLPAGPFRMHDDGQSGDFVAGDGVCTALISLTNYPPGDYSLDIAAEYRGLRTNTSRDLMVYPRNMTGWVWEMDVAGLEPDGYPYDPKVHYSMRLQILESWALTNWYRHLVPGQGEGFIFLDLTLTNPHDYSARIEQEWEMVGQSGTVTRPWVLSLPLEGSVSSLHQSRYLGWSVDNKSSVRSLVVFEAKTGDMPYTLHIDKRDSRGEILEIPVGRSSVQYPDTRPVYGDLNLLPRILVAEGIEVYDVASDSEGNILLACGCVSQGGSALVTLSTISPYWEWSCQDVCEVPGELSSIAVMEDSSGTLHVVVAAHRLLQVSPIAQEAVSLWLSSRDAGSSSWSEPRRIYSSTWQGEGLIVPLDLSLEEDGCGDFWIFMNRPGRSYYVTLFIKSHDQGATWTGEQRFFDPGSNTRFDSLLLDAEGGLRVVYRARLFNGRGEIRQTVSLDCGKSWEQPELLLPYPETRLSAIYQEPACWWPYQSTGPRLWFVWQNDIVGRENYYVEYSEDGGETWNTYGFLGAGHATPQLAFDMFSTCREPGDSLHVFWKQGSSIYYASVSEQILIFGLISLSVLSAGLVSVDAVVPTSGPTSLMQPSRGVGQ